MVELLFFEHLADAIARATWLNLDAAVLASDAATAAECRGWPAPGPADPRGAGCCSHAVAAKWHLSAESDDGSATAPLRQLREKALNNPSTRGGKHFCREWPPAAICQVMRRHRKHRQQYQVRYQPHVLASEHGILQKRKPESHLRGTPKEAAWP